MFQPIRFPNPSLLRANGAESRRRFVGIALALLVEGLLGLLLLTLAPSTPRQKETELTVFSFDTAADQVPSPQRAENPSEPDTPQPRPPERPPEDARTPPELAEPQPAPRVPPLIPLSREQMAAADIAAMPRRPAEVATPRPPTGPPDVAIRGDTPRVEGAGPNGEPLYAASWYREPYDDELRGYLSTSRGPGWGLIACRTVRDFRVEDCVAVGEYPERSNIVRSVLAAAWQFRVRPPQIGGQLKIGEWVRIRIDYDITDDRGGRSRSREAGVGRP